MHNPSNKVEPGDSFEWSQLNPPAQGTKYRVAKGVRFVQEQPKQEQAYPTYPTRPTTIEIPASEVPATAEHITQLSEQSDQEWNANGEVGFLSPREKEQLAECLGRSLTPKTPKDGLPKE